ncbi:TKL/TKL-ccin protein kinase [Marasmius fiardii PR-910]|nr:TKL/TKL-ccin protein kinase [Marasmius fiardii PR-910]
MCYSHRGPSRCITGVKARVEKWAKLTWPRALVQLNEIQAAIDVSKAEIAECFLRFQLASAADTSRWQTEFTDVARLDHEETIAYLSSIQDGQEIMKDSSTDKYVAISKNLHNIQASTKTLLPNLHLVSGEITDIEVHPVSSTITADVFRGCYLHRETVAIKVLRSVKPDEKTKQRFSREVRIWECIYNIDRGKYILPFYGFGEGSDSRPFMVSPWQENGNALSYVRENDEKVNYKEMITGIAEGLKVLHSLMKPPIVHGDIRAENIFINSEGNPLLSDFGLSKMTEEMTNIPFTQSAGVADLYRWFAPEIHIGSGSVSLSSDIYSFGMTVLELFTHQYPFSKIKHPSEVVLVVARGRKPPQPKEARVVERGLDDDMWRLLIECWDHIPSARPDIEEVLERLSDWDYFHDCQVTLLR